MSFREQRSFIEKMRTLGYSKLISLDSFRNPNFELVADILLWLLKNYDPNNDISPEINEEYERVVFIKSVATFMAQKANIKLHTRKLYCADGLAVKEMLKIATVLYDAKNASYDDEDEINVPVLDVSSRIAQLKTCRILASDITEKGANLYDLLLKELEVTREARSQVISRPFELKEMVVAINDSIRTMQDSTSSIKSALQNLEADEASLVGKIEKKKIELDRAEKRLKSLKVVRPAYMDEYERIEVELAKLYDSYIEKYRNLTYLENQLEEHNRQEQEKAEETELSLKRMQHRLREEEMRMLRGDKEIKDTIKGGFGGGRPKAASKRGNARDADESDSEDNTDGEELGMDDGSENSETTEDGGGGDNIEIDGDDDDEDGEMDGQSDLDENMGGGGGGGGGRRRVRDADESDSDEEEDHGNHTGDDNDF